MNTKVYNPRVQLNSGYDERLLEYNTYRNNYTEPPPQPLSLSTQPEFITEKRYVHLSSATRNRYVYTNPARFRYDLTPNLRNVKSVKVIQGTLPNITAVNTHPVIFLDIDDFNYISIQGLGIDVVAALTLESSTATGFLNIDTKVLKCIQPPTQNMRDKVEYLTVTLRDGNGTVLTLGTENGNDPVDNSIQWSVLLEFEVLVPKPIKQITNHAVLLNNSN